jgi:hypothetical protein
VRPRRASQRVCRTECPRPAVEVPGESVIHAAIVGCEDPYVEPLLWYQSSPNGWEDVNFEALEVNVTRSVVKEKITRCKTEASRKPIPLDAELAEVLWSWKLRCPYPQPGDWVFASPHKKGKQPYRPGSLFRVHLKPAPEAAGIPGNVGWHTRDTHLAP